VGGFPRRGGEPPRGHQTPRSQTLNRANLRAIAVGLALSAALPLTARGATLPPVGCSWPVKLDADTLNTAFPDSSATYWGTRFVSLPGSRIVVRGTYPAARYFSLHAYDDLQRPVGSLADREIAPDPGSDNPFATPGAAPGGAYTAYVEFTARPATPAPNTLYAGAMADGTQNPGGFILLRVYVPDDPTELSGGVAEPKIPDLELEVADGAVRIPFGRCEPLPPSTGGALTDAIAQMSFPDAVPRSIPFLPATTTPEFRRFFGLDRTVWDRVPPNPATDPIPRFQGGFLSNQHIAYLYKILSREYGDVFVFRAKAPTFPDTRPPGTGSPTDPTQVRYWSICENELATQRFIACLADYQTRIDAEGYFTFVVADPADKPSNLDATGANWLPWGGAFYDGLVIYRHMLPATAFAEAIQNVPEFADAATLMGEYFPRGAYCTKQRFENGGPAACLDGT
jgi:hypothetical protein